MANQRWCPDVVRLQGALDLGNLKDARTLKQEQVQQPVEEKPANKFRLIEVQKRQADSFAEMRREANDELMAYIDAMPDEDVEMAYQAAVESGLISPEANGL